MAFQGFGKASGPSAPPNSSTPFGTFPRPPSPSPPQPFPVQRFPRASEAIVRPRSPPLAFGSNANNYASSSVYPLAKVATTASEAPDSMRSPPKASASIRPTNFSSQSAALYRATEFPPTTRDNGEKYIAKGNDAQNYKRPSAVTSFVASRNSGTSVTATVTRSQDFKGNRSTPLLPNDFLSNSNQAMTRSHPIAGDVNQSHIFPLRAQPSPFVSESNSYVEKHSSFGEAQRHSDMLVNNHNRPGSQITQSPPAAFVNSHFDEHFPPLGEARRPAVSSAWGGRPKLPGNNSDLVAHENLSMVSSYGSSYDSRMSSLNQPVDLHGQKRNRSPPTQPVNGFHGYSQSSQDDTKRPSVSPPRLSTRSNLSSSNSQSHRRSLQSLPKFDVEPAATKPANSSLPKRTRSPPLLSAEQSGQGNSSQDDTEREMQAKAKRLQRFKTELSETVQNSSDIADQNMSTIRSGRSTMDRGKPVAEFSSDAAGDFSNDNADNEGMELSNVITGLCPDMCPESERAERERKGDLDQYERIDGDRNQTSKSLAIKKYTRTAEREASLIRPMPILQKTIDYLLNLLDQPYNDKFLGLYNFLWDRMRAIRMDLRMQHIFNRGAITMLEQMIRLHIIAMHELCEYTKGEGFSEGFDAHLNIEQMNKTSVELFQMYDDHRKKGINVPTEKEFRGYYALLKLDKHPGYKVEPAELSLDLAKMTPEIRQTSDVLFARDVARACRTGNFIAFFRLARKATYLQACLMHAHFSKLRTQALASLHCGVQINQGLPVSHVANWLGMEEEDIESLLEYHGFVVKEFEEPYIVKEGPFINVDTDYPTKCSKLVHLKKSRCIADDVLAACLVASLPTEEDQEINLDEICNPDQKTSVSVERDSYVRVDEEMKDFEIRASPKGGSQVQPVFGTTVIGQQSKADRQMAGVSNLQWDFSFPRSSPLFQPVKAKTVEEPNVDVLFNKSSEKIMDFGKEEIPSQIVMSTTQQDTSPSKIVLRTTQQDISPSNIVPRKTQQDISPNGQINFTVESSAPLSLAGSNNKDKDAAKLNDDDDDDDECMENQDEEVVEAKLKLILRLWKRRSSRQRELRKQRQLAASAALNSLSLGPPIRLSKDQLNIVGEFDIDHVMRERYKKHERSCSRLNVSDVVASVLSRRNPDARCLCWKLVVCSQMNNLEGEVQNSCQVAHMAAGPWLHSKLMPANIDDDDLVISSPDLSLWKKWIPSSSDVDHTCCLSVVKDANFDNLNETVSGASGVLFLVSEHLPWELQKIQLHNLVMSLPPASCLPLLILSSSYSEDVSDPSSNIVNKLGIHEIDKTRISSYMVVHLVGNQLMEQSDGFLSDDRLREGLQWLAGESPPQPSLDCVKTRSLIFAHLNSSLELLDEMCDIDICPEHCISAFNAALDQSKLEVDGAAKANTTCWPCPEVDLLDEFSYEHRVANLYLPSIGWSHAARVEPLMCALNDCKLPNFPNISWLNRGSNGGNEIENQRLELENCLIRYLTETTNMMGFALAKNEASVMLQKSARLELRNSTYYIVPSWVKIFRRIYNWRLACLSSGDLSSAYVFEERVGASMSLGLATDKLGPQGQGSFSSLHHLNQPGLDEMVEVSCCSPINSHNEDLAATVAAPLALTRNVVDATECGNNDESRSIEGVKNNASCVVNNCFSNNVSVGTQETEKLSKLLEQCNILQDMIDQKLSIYF